MLDKVSLIIEQNDNDGDIAKALDDDSIRSVQILPDVFEKGDDKYVDMVDWKIGISGPINSDVEELIVFVKISEIIPPRAKKLDEARGLVTADYQAFLEKEWIEQLKKKYPVRMNKEVLDLIISDHKN